MAAIVTLSNALSLTTSRSKQASALTSLVQHRIRPKKNAPTPRIHASTNAFLPSMMTVGTVTSMAEAAPDQDSDAKAISQSEWGKGVRMLKLGRKLGWNRNKTRLRLKYNQV
ncbi:MAG: hypothetical protein AB7P20_26260 [Rhizobiaceae bacterium]